MSIYRYIAGILRMACLGAEESRAHNNPSIGVFRGMIDHRGSTDIDLPRQRDVDGSGCTWGALYGVLLVLFVLNVCRGMRPF